MGFKTVFAKPTDGFWGSPQGNGTWNGLVGTLERNCNKYVLFFYYYYIDSRVLFEWCNYM
jgi:hypothetical protein